MIRKKQPEDQALVAALQNLAALGTKDANPINERARQEFLRLCPEFIGYLKTAESLLSCYDR